MEEKKSKAGIIIVIIILLLIALFAVWYFVLRNDTKPVPKNNNNTEEKKPKDDDTPKNNTGYEYDYKDGVLTQIVDEEGNPKQTDFVINGLILVGNRHSYAGLEAGVEGVLEKLVAQGYKKEGINSSFYLNEYIEFYIDTDYVGSDNDVKIIVVPHKTVDEYEKMSIVDLATLAEDNGGFIITYQKPDEDNYKYVGEGYVNMDYPEGKYDIIFAYKGKVAYFVELSLIKEPTE